MQLKAWAIVALVGGLVFSSSAFSQSAQTGSQPAQIGGPTPSPLGAKLEFIDLKDGAVIGPRTTIHFGLQGMVVAPAGTRTANSGHHHLLIDTDLPPLDQPIPNDEHHLHFGGGQTEVELTRCRRVPTRSNCCWATPTISLTIRRFIPTRST